MNFWFLVVEHILINVHRRSYANGGTCFNLIDGYLCSYISNHISCSISINETCFSRLYSCQNNGTYTLKSHNGYVDNSITDYQCHYGYNGR